MNQFPADFPHTLTGFGGDPDMNQAQHREHIRKCPVILVHGNATNATDPKYGMQAMQEFLKGADYQDCEIWALNYLGENNTTPQLFKVHVQHIDAVRDFADKVRDYLGVERIDFITHSLGCGMINGYLRGLQASGKWNNEADRAGAVGTFVSIAGAQYGLGPNGIDEFKTGGPFEVASHRFHNTVDDTPFGNDDESEQSAPDHGWEQTTSLDDNQVCYVAIIAREDFVDQQNRDTSRRVGADLNKVFNVGTGTAGHEKIIKEQAVFDSFLKYLNRYPPVPPVSFSVDKESGNFDAGLVVTVSVSPADATVACTAKRVTKTVQAGFLSETVAETRNETLTDKQSLTLAHDGAWDLKFTASSGPALERTYGVNVLTPELTILTENGTPFQGSLEVKTKASKGTVYYSTDKTHWLASSNPTIHETTTLYFIAIGADGLASPIVSRAYEKKAVEFVKASLTEHFIAHRLDIRQYVDLTLQLGANAVVTLYHVNGKWVRDPDTLEVALAPPDLTVSDEGGLKTEPVTVAVAARHPTDAAPVIYYTLDGTMPTRYSPCFTSSGRILLDNAGTTTLKYRACDAAGNWSDTVTKTYRLDVGDTLPKIACDKPSGVYPATFNPVISLSSAADPATLVYYTEDGSDPADPDNPQRKSFEGKKRFTIRGNGAHAIRCYAKDRAGKEAFGAFGWQVDDQDYPETRIAPSMGGRFAGQVRIELSPSEPCEWTRYTLDGSEPTETTGETYAAPIVLDRSARLSFCSRSLSGKLEPVRSATFIVTPQPDLLVFESEDQGSGSVVAMQDQAQALVGTGNLLRIGAVGNGDSRAILQFDTSSLPDNAAISHACLEVALHTKSGDPWAGGKSIQIDVQSGTFGTARALHGDDWDAPASAEGVAQVGKFSSGACKSSDFSQAGLDAINKTGVTQIRLRIAAPNHARNGASLVLEGAPAAKLYITLANPAH